MDTDPFTLNGIDATSGNYLTPPVTAQALASVARGEPIDRAQLTDLKSLQRRFKTTRGIKEGMDPRDLADAGWGVLFAHDADPAIHAALDELLVHRRAQASRKNPRRFREFSGDQGFQPGESKSSFIDRAGAAAGPADPDKLPYYLLIVGDPETIPFTFQYQLDVQYAVGRIHFDTAEEYARYAHNVVAMETGGVVQPKRAAFFGVQNPDDRATEQSCNQFIQPLATWAAQDRTDWTVDTIVKEQATKPCLRELLGGSQTPALLFTASHGVGFPNGHPLQLQHQGALLCQEWPGPQEWHGAIPPDYYFSADDLDSGAHLAGLIAFHFACYGAGTPALDSFAQQAFQQRAPIAPHAFIAGLPRRVLAHPNGGALAVIGHVERAWGYSFKGARSGQQLVVFQDLLKRLMQGNPVGWAIESLNGLYAEMATVLNDELEELRFGKRPDEVNLASLWTIQNDARNYVVLGDPAVRLPVQNAPAPVTPVQR